MAPIRLAFVGCGLITEEQHLPAALATPGIEIAALVDAQAARVDLLRRKYGCANARAATSLESVIDTVDAVAVCTPNDSHFALASLAVAKGRPVLVEKPMTTTSAEAADLCALAERHAVPISVGFVTRHFPVVRLAKRLIDEGVLGTLRRFRFEYGTRGGWAPVSGYNLSQSRSGGGVLVVSGTHFLDRMLAWFGAPTTCTYLDDAHGGVEANCHAHFGFESGLVGSVYLSKTMRLANTFVLETDRYVLELPWGETEAVMLRSRELPGTITTLRDDPAPPKRDPFQAQMEEFARVVRGEQSPTVDARGGAASVRLCEDLYAVRQTLDEPWVWYRPSQAGEHG